MDASTALHFKYTIQNNGEATVLFSATVLNQMNNLTKEKNKKDFTYTCQDFDNLFRSSCIIAIKQSLRKAWISNCEDVVRSIFWRYRFCGTTDPSLLHHSQATSPENAKDMKQSRYNMHLRVFWVYMGAIGFFNHTATGFIECNSRSWRKHIPRSPNNVRTSPAVIYTHTVRRKCVAGINVGYCSTINEGWDDKARSTTLFSTPELLVNMYNQKNNDLSSELLCAHDIFRSLNEVCLYQEYEIQHCLY